jgi:hypothetical protein
MSFDGMVALDIGDANSFTGYACGSIAPGDLVIPVSGAYTFDSIGSRSSTYRVEQIALIAGSNDTTVIQLCVGMAMSYATSGLPVTVLKRGIVVLPSSSGAQVAGKSAVPVGYGIGTTTYWNNNCVGDLSAGAGSVFPIGKTLTAATAEGKFRIISLNI